MSKAQMTKSIEPVTPQKFVNDLWAARVSLTLIAAVELDLFTTIAQGKKTVADIAKAVQAPKRGIERLLDAQIGDPGHLLQLVEQIDRELAVGVDVPSDDLDVDRRGQPEIQDLTDDVGRQKVEHRAWKALGQPLAQWPNVVLGRTMVRLERHDDVGICGPHRSRVVVGEVGSARWQADIVDDCIELAGRNDLADFGFHEIAQARGLFDARAGFSAQVKLDLAGVDAWEEIATDERQQRRGGYARE